MHFNKYELTIRTSISDIAWAFHVMFRVSDITMALSLISDLYDCLQNTHKQCVPITAIHKLNRECYRCLDSMWGMKSKIRCSLSHASHHLAVLFCIAQCVVNLQRFGH